MTVRPVVSDATGADYQNLLRRLLPPGLFFRRLGGKFNDALLGLGDELARVHNRANDLCDEADPRTADETLAAWERLLNLPSPCNPYPPATDADRRLVIHARLTATGGVNEAYFIELAENIGATAVTITYPYKPFRCGVSRCGEALGPVGANFVWQLNCTLAAALRPYLECLMAATKPAHTQVQFFYV